MSAKPTCLNPNCRKAFKPGHYGSRQVMCGSLDCRKWYKMYWSQTRKPPRGIPPAIFGRILSAIPKDDSRRVMLLTARYSALRKGELLGLVWSDVLDHEGNCKQSVNVVRQWDDRRGVISIKTKDTSVAYLLAPAREAIQRLAGLEKRKPQDRMFPFWESKAYSWFIGLQTKLEIVNPETGHPYRFHDLRHTGIREQADVNGIEFANRFARHKRMDTTKIYTERPVEDTVAIMEKALPGGEKDPNEGKKGVSSRR